MARDSKNKKKSVDEVETPIETKKIKKKKERKKKKHPILFGIFLVIFCIFVTGALTSLIVGNSVLSYVDGFINGKIVVNLDNYKSSQSQTSIMYAYKDNNQNKPIEVTRLHGEENRIWVSYDEMPDDLLWAFVCLEDKRFYEHKGVDWIRTIGVFVNPSLDGQGGSTITQQLIKNLTDQKDVTYIRKFNEILRALNLEKSYSKTEILEAYLNTVYLGAGCYGVKTAAEVYFGKDVKDLNLQECATLAGITQAPYSWNPYINYDGCMKRRQDCLYYMHDQGKINDKEYKKAIKTKIKLVEEKDTTESEETEKTKINTWYEEYVIDQVIADLMAEYDYEYNEAWRMVYYGGLSIYSAVDLEAQDYLESVYRNRTGFPYANYDSRGELPQSAMTIMDYQGRIIALAGGCDKKTANRAYNRATDNRAKRQPGSSIKPLGVYAPAIDLGLVSPGSSILEKAITYGGMTWPRNFNGDFGSGSYISVQEALVRSLNTVPVRILSEMLGVQASFDYCNDRFHLNLSKTDMDLSPLAVGGTNTGVTTLEMAAAFATFGNGGKYYKPYSYYKVLSRDGEVLLDNTKNKPQQSLKSSTANSCLSMMTKAVTQGNGTGYGSQIPGFQTFAKTGTTSDNCDKWYCGGTPHYVAAVWYGYDYRANLYTGSTNPSKSIFRTVFSGLHENLPSKSFADVILECGGTEDDVNSYAIYTPVASGDGEEKTTKETESTKPDKTSENEDESTTAEKTTSGGNVTEAPQIDTTRPNNTTVPPTQGTTAPTTASTTVPPTTVPPTTEAPVTQAPTVPPTTLPPQTTVPPTAPPTAAPTAEPAIE